MTKNDRYIIIAVILLSVGVFVFTRSNSKPQSLIITKSGKEIQNIKFPVNKTIEFKSEGKKWTIEIAGNRARVIQADCPEKICQGQGWIIKSNETITCVPLELIVELKGLKNRDKIDAVTE
jgi:hypothetical protein